MPRHYAYIEPQVRGALETLHILYTSIVTSFSALVASVPAFAEILQASITALHIGQAQISALCKSLKAPPLISFALSQSLTVCTVAALTFALGVLAFVLCMLCSGLSLALSIALTMASGLLFSLSGFVALVGGMVVVPTLLLSGSLSVGIAAVAISMGRVSGQDGARKRSDSAEADDDDVAESKEGFVCVTSPASAAKASSGWMNVLFRRKKKEEAQEAPREGRVAPS